MSTCNDSLMFSYVTTKRDVNLYNDSHKRTKLFVQWLLMSTYNDSLMSSYTTTNRDVNLSCYNDSHKHTKLFRLVSWVIPRRHKLFYWIESKWENNILR